MGKISMREVLKTALRIFGYTLAFGFIGFMFTPTLMNASPALRIPLIGVMIVAAGMLLFMDGSYRGERDCVMSETLDKHAEKGDYKASPDEESKRYNRLKGILSAAFAALPFFIMAVLVAITAKPYTYALQDLPSWMGAYLERPEIGDAVRYLQAEPAGASVFDYLRIAVRFMLFPYIGIIGNMTDDVSLLFDRVAPLLTLIMPGLSAIGYQFGPRRRAKSAKAIEEAKNTPRKRLKKDRKKGGSVPREKKQLI